MITTLQKRTRKEILLEDLKRFIQREKLTKDTFRFLDRMLFLINLEIQGGSLSKVHIAQIHSWFDNEFLEATVQGRGFMKPNGYPGDYLFLDHIYTNHKSPDPKYRIWDEFVQQHAAPKAVRNRKEYFKKLVFEKALTKSAVNLLNIVSGSGRELLEMYNVLPHKNVNTTCVEIDEKAIKFSRRLNQNHLDKIAYVNSNIFKYRNGKPHDMIWSAGLFDYLNDKAFVLLLKKFKAWLAPKGEIIIGNYNEEYNPSRAYLEVLGEWHLIHRTKEQLYDLAKKAGFSACQIKINNLDDNVILYLHLKN